MKKAIKRYTYATIMILFVAFVSILGVRDAKADDGTGTGIGQSEEFAGVLGVGDIIKSIPAPGLGDPRGLTWDGTYLWMAEDDSKMIYKIDPSDGTVIDSFSTPGQSFTEGLAWDGTYIWHAEYNGNVYKINPSDGSIIQTISAPTSYPTGLTWDGAYLWTPSYRDLMIYQFSSSTGSLINSFSSPGSTPWGMAWDGTYLWHSEYGGGNIYQLDPSDGTVITSFSSPAGSWLLGLTWDGAYLWAVDHNANMIYQIDAGVECDYCLEDSYGFEWCLNVIDQNAAGIYLAGTVDWYGEEREAVATFLKKNGGVSMSAGAGSSIPFNYNWKLQGTGGSGVWINISPSAGHGLVDVWMCGTATGGETEIVGPAPGVIK